MDHQALAQCTKNLLYLVLRRRRICSAVKHDIEGVEYVQQSKHDNKQLNTMYMQCRCVARVHQTAIGRLDGQVKES